MVDLYRLDPEQLAIAVPMLRQRRRLKTELDGVLTEVEEGMSDPEPTHGHSHNNGRHMSAKEVLEKARARSQKTERVLSLLIDAGPAGMKIADLAKKLKNTTSNMYQFFSGLDFKGVKKIGKAHYAWAP